MALAINVIRSHVRLAYLLTKIHYNTEHGNSKQRRYADKFG
jgi:hypothetical protein